MSHAKKRLFALAALAGVALGGCSLDQADPNFPDSQQPEAFIANFSLPTATSPVPFLPYPWDGYFADSTDLTVNIPAGLLAPPFFTWGTAINTLDGFSTTAPIQTTFSLPIDGASLSPTNVVVAELNLGAPGPFYIAPNPANPVRRVLQFGVDYTAAVAPDFDSGGKILQITPVNPLTPGTAAEHVGYMVLLTNGIRDTSGNAAQPSETFTAMKPPADCATLGDLASLCALTQGLLAIGNAIGQQAGIDLSPANVVMAWSFTTQSVDATFDWISAAVPAQPILALQNTGLTTAAIGAFGKANIYAGLTQTPYYLTPASSPTDPAVLSGYWTAAGPPPAGLDPASRNLTRFNPVPLKITDQVIPLLVTVPNATAAGGACTTRPPNGWGVVIFQHGITRSRMDALAIADAYAEACYIVAAIDAPLHGVTPTGQPDNGTAPPNPFAAFATPYERTMNLDYRNNVTGAAGPDGIADPSAGVASTTYLNLTSVLNTRDNFRQSEADQIVFAKTVLGLDVTGDSVPDVDPTRVHFIGQSLGGIVGGVHVRFVPDLATATLNVPGGVITQLILNSGTFAPIFVPPVAAKAPEGSVQFNNFWNQGQAVLDSGDPVNHIANAKDLHPVFMQMVVNDQTVPNISTERLISAGQFAKIFSNPAPGGCPGTTVAAGSGGYTEFNSGSHGSLLDPSSSLAVTTEMQKEVVAFAATADSGSPCGAMVIISDPSVIQP